MLTLRLRSFVTRNIIIIIILIQSLVSLIMQRRPVHILLPWCSVLLSAQSDPLVLQDAPSSHALARELLHHEVGNTYGTHFNLHQSRSGAIWKILCRHHNSNNTSSAATTLKNPIKLRHPSYRVSQTQKSCAPPSLQCPFVSCASRTHMV